ncbi:MAG: GDP-mannose transporter, golgi apparatus [Monoraphidium minutum]|nr:MAG: GDP-mannose transporter, golgi apparatus [Monoraphidium minutum]
MGGPGPPSDGHRDEALHIRTGCLPTAHVSMLRSPSHSKELRQHQWAALEQQRERRALGPNAIFAGVCWIMCSSSIILLNKVVLSRYHFTAPTALLAYHCAIAAALLRGAAALGLVEIAPLTREVLVMWLPLNFIFVAMLLTAFRSLALLGVGVMSLLKNLTNLFIVAGDYFLMRRTYSWHVGACLLVMVAAAAGGAASDAAFSPAGYAWQLLNCLLTAAYALYLSHVTQRLSTSAAPQAPPPDAGDGASPRAAGAPAAPRRVNEASMAYYNNLLALPLALALMLFGEVHSLGSQPALRDPMFQLFAFLGGVVGLGISFCSIWFMSLSSATLYTLTGSMNKFLVAAAGMWLFAEGHQPRYVASIVLGLAAGGLLPFIKMKAKPKPALLPQASGHEGDSHPKG